MRSVRSAPRPWRSLPQHPSWLAGLAVALAFAVGCALLGQWQWHRKQVRDHRNAVITANYDLDVVAATGVVSGGTVPPGVEWTPVRLRGRYVADATVLVRNRPQGGANGYLVSAPLLLDEPVGGRDEVWLLRGWIPAGDDAGTAPSPQPPAEGTVSVVARLRPPEPPTDRPAPAGQAYRVDPTALAVGGGRSAAVALDGYGVVVTETPAAGGPGVVPVTAPRPVITPGPHLAYTVQWYLFAVAGLLIWAVLYRRADDDDAGTTTPVASRVRADPWTYAPGG